MLLAQLRDRNQLDTSRVNDVILGCVEPVQEQAADIGFLSVAGGAVRTEFVGTWAAALVEAGVITAAAVPVSAREKWVEPQGDRRVELVFIGVGLDEAAMRVGLARCLV